MFAHMLKLPGDPIFASGEACRRDLRKNKVDLTVGLYHDGAGRIPLLESVRQAEHAYLRSGESRPYLPIAGLDAYRTAVQRLVFGAESDALRNERVATIQSIGGSGALRVGAEFIHAAYPDSEVWISQPAYANHAGIFGGAGMPVHYYPYYDAQRHMLTFDRMYQVISGLPARSIVLLHGCCHNPSGADLDRDQWRTLTACMAERNLIPFVDLAYQGFAHDLDEDAWPVRFLAQSGIAFLVANSLSKNLSLYGERCGGLSVVCEKPEQAEGVLSQLVAIVRAMYSNPPIHGARIAATVLASPELRAMWIKEVEAMRRRMRVMRGMAHEQLAVKAPGYNADYVLHQTGMFSLTDLSSGQIRALREEHAVHVIDSGRICIAGLNEGNIEHFTDAMAAVVASPAKQESPGE